MLNGSPEDVRRATQACMAASGARAISAAGCEIPLGTPHANLRMQAAALAEFDGSSVAEQVA
jgi:uroporphyrinogen-III decarboxylase